jgi:O-antigen/teichoic acid export membrane protein
MNVDSRLPGDFKRLAGGTAVYATGTLVVRGLAFLLLPVYTRFLTPADFGVLAFTTAVTSALLTLITVNLHGSVTFLYFNAVNEDQRRRNIGTVWIAMLLFSISAAWLIDRTGAHLASSISLSVAFDPYVRLAVWIALLNTLSLIPLNLLQIEERPARYAVLSICGALVATGLILWFVVIRGEGAYGLLMGTLLGAMIMTAPYVWTVARRIRLAFDGRCLRWALAYSLPLVLHNFAAWMLALSDRVILERFVSLEQLGLYSIGYLLASAIYVFGTTINSALTPIVFRRISGISDAAARSDLARLATYFAAAVLWAALGLVVLAGVLLRVLTTPAYLDAEKIMPWVALGMLMHALYLVPANLLFARERTWTIAAATLSSGVIVVALNFWWIPRFGILGAAWASAAGYGLMLLFVWFAAQRVYPLAYEYSRLAKLSAAAAALLAAASACSFADPWADALWRAVLWLAFPFLLLALKFYHSGELQLALRLARWRR